MSMKASSSGSLIYLRATSPVLEGRYDASVRHASGCLANSARACRSRVARYCADWMGHHCQVLSQSQNPAGKTAEKTSSVLYKTAFSYVYICVTLHVRWVVCMRQIWQRRRRRQNM